MIIFEEYLEKIYLNKLSESEILTLGMSSGMVHKVGQVLLHENSHKLGTVSETVLLRYHLGRWYLPMLLERVSRF